MGCLEVACYTQGMYTNICKDMYVYIVMIGIQHRYVTRYLTQGSNVI